MRKAFLRVLPSLIVIAFFASACNFPAPDTADATGTPALSSGTSSPVSTQTSVPTPEPDTSGSDPCLQGHWVMSLESLRVLIATLLPMANFSVPQGTLTMTFTGESYTYASEEFVLRMDTKSGEYFEGVANFTAVGTFSTTDGKILFENSTYTQNITSWRAFINGEYIEVPGGAPQISFGFPGNGPYTCSSDTLTVGTRDTANTPVPMIFTRIP